DGTLTLPGHIDFAAMRRRIGIPPGTDILAQIRELPEDQQAAAVAIVEEEEMAALQKLELQPGLHELVAALRARRVRCAIATRNMAAAVDFFFTSSGLERELFAPVLTRDFAHNKPDARVALAIVRAWRLPPAAVAFVGDHVDDMACGRGAGCVTCLVRCEENDAFYAEDGGALVDHAIAALSELPALLRLPRGGGGGAAAEAAAAAEEPATAAM
ncbi:HAD-like domain-containing protein, partial [Tribonema minus]